MKNKILKPWLRGCAALGLALLASNLRAQTVTTIGGGAPAAPYSGYQDGPTLQARFNQPAGLAMDPGGNYLFVADYSNNVVRIITQPGTGASTTTFSNSFLPAVTRGISRPISVIVDGATNVYVLNQGNGKNGTLLQFNAVSLGYPTFVTTNASLLTNATAMAVDGLTNLYVTVGYNTVLRITPPGAASVVGVITNPGTRLQGIVVLDNGQLALSDAGTNSGIWLMNPAGNLSNNVTKLAGFNGTGDNPDYWPVPAAYAIFNHPANLAKAGNGVLVVTDTGNNRVKLLDTISGTVTLLYGVNSNYWGNPNTTSDKYPGWLDGASGILAGYAESRLPYGVVVAPDGSVFTAEDYYHVLRHVTGTGLQPPAPPPPNAPTILTVTTNYGQVRLTWSAVTGATNYNVKRATSPGAEITIATTSGTSYTDTTVINGTTYYYVVSALGAAGESLNSSEIAAIPPIPPPPAPRIGWYDYEGNETIGFFTVLHPVSIATFNNDQLLAIDPNTNGVLTYYTTDGSIPSATNGGTPPFYQDNKAYVQPLPVSIVPDLVIKAVNIDSIGQSSPITVAEFRFQTATPVNIAPNTLDPFHIQLSCVTSNAIFYYTLDGSDPRTNLNSIAWYPSDGLLKIDPSYFTNGPVTLKVVAKKYGYYDSGLFQNVFNNTNGVYVLDISPNSGYYPMGQIIQVKCPGTNVHYTMDGTEPSANSSPVLNIVNYIGYIRWFNTTNDLTNLRVKAFLGGTNVSATVSGQPVTVNNIGTPTDINSSLQAGIGSTIVVPVVCNLGTNQQVKSFQLRYEIAPANNKNTPVISALSIMPTNDFVPVATAVQTGVMGSYSVQPYSLGLTNGLVITTGSNIFFQHFAVVAMIEVQIPHDASEGDTYSLNVLFPSATSDGYNAGVPLTPMAPTTIVVTNIPYVVGDSASASGSWYNAGTFGDDNLDNADVNQAFYASSGLRVPYSFSDVFNAMDVYPPDASGFVGGDGQIRFLDWMTILQRSLRLDTNDWSRAWSPGGVLVDVTTNLVVPHLQLTKPAAKANGLASPWYRQALVGGDSVSYATPGGTVNVPVYVKLQNGATLSGLQFRTVITPQNGAPAVAGSPQLTLASGVTTPYLQNSFKAAEAAFGWTLGSFSYQSRSSNFIGWVSFTVPATALSGQTYAVSFANADGSPDLNTQYDFESRSATVAVNAASPPASICPDDWKIYFFGSPANPAAADNADPDGDGVPNWMEYLTGTDPTSPQSRLQLSISALPTGKNPMPTQLNWLTAPGKAYELQSRENLADGNWTTMAIVSGDGSVTNLTDTNPPATTRYYRLYVLP